jgi:hypothetical protein
MTWRALSDRPCGVAVPGRVDTINAACMVRGEYEPLVDRLDVAAVFLKHAAFNLALCLMWARTFQLKLTVCSKCTSVMPLELNPTTVYERAYVYSTVKIV